MQIDSLNKINSERDSSMMVMAKQIGELGGRIEPMTNMVEQ